MVRRILQRRCAAPGVLLRCACRALTRSCRASAALIGGLVALRCRRAEMAVRYGCSFSFVLLCSLFVLFFFFFLNTHKKHQPYHNPQTAFLQSKHRRPQMSSAEARHKPARGAFDFFQN
jgi:hypothetical protein